MTSVSGLFTEDLIDRYLFTYKYQICIVKEKAANSHMCFYVRIQEPNILWTIAKRWLPPNLFLPLFLFQYITYYCTFIKYLVKIWITYLHLYISSSLYQSSMHWWRG